MATATGDPSRVFDGFTNLQTGVDGGRSPSLILQTSVAAASNTTFRGSYAQTRDSWSNRPITVPSSLANRWTGIYQGSEFYDGEGVPSGWLISRGGRIFFLDASTFALKEITISATVTVTTAFTVNALNELDTVNVSDAEEFTVGQNLLIDSGSFQVKAIFSNSIQVQYQGGFVSLPHTVAAGDVVQDSSGNSIAAYDQNQETDDFVFIFQAEKWGIILAGQHSPLIWDGNKLRRSGVNEIPPGILGAYGWGRIWITLPDRRSFVAGNLVGDQSGGGTAQEGFRDSILKFTENNFLNGGGTFSIPQNAGKINTMQFLATQDTSLGMGVLLVGTQRMIFSVNAPVDRTTWQNLTYPIQTVSLLDYGPEGPRSSVSINGDMWYRSFDGYRSFIVARRQFGMPGNTPMSQEVSPILSFDTLDLLFWGSGIYFDNYMIQTISPFRTAAGVLHRGFVVINFDLISDLRQKLPPAWEGVWSGLNIFQITKGRIDNEERAFCFVMGNDIELWEISGDLGPSSLTLTSRGAQKGSTGDSINGVTTPIAAFIETQSYAFGSPFTLLKLRMAEFYIDDIADNVTVTVKFQPDQYPDWITWGTFSFCATVSQCTFTSSLNNVCQVFKANAAQYAARVTLPQPQEALCSVIAGRPLNFGFEFQLRIEWTGHCRFRVMRLHANLVDLPSEGECAVAPTCVAFPFCDTNYFAYSSRGS